MSIDFGVETIFVFWTKTTSQFPFFLILVERDVIYILPCEDVTSRSTKTEMKEKERVVWVWRAKTCDNLHPM